MATADIRRAALIHIKWNIREGFSFSGTLTDSDDAAVDLSGKELVYSIRDSQGGTALATLTTTGGEIVVSGASNNIFTITAETIEGLLGRAYKYDHDLENTTDNRMLFDGYLYATYGAHGT